MPCCKDETNVPGVFQVFGFVLGPFRSKDPSDHWGVEENIRNAEKLLLKLWRHGIPSICPHTNTRFFQGAAPDYFWLQGYKFILSKASFVLCVDGWRRSVGSVDEVALADKLRIPIYEEKDFDKLIHDVTNGDLQVRCSCSTADLDMRDRHGEKPDKG